MNERNDLFKKLEDQELQAKDYGFYWENIQQLIDQIQSECLEIREAFEAGDPMHLQEEVGDLLHASLSLAVFCGLDTHDTLNKSTEKFKRRFEKVMELAKKDGHTHLREKSFDLLMHYWDRAKLLD